MDYLPEFPNPTRRELEAVNKYLTDEPNFMAAENFYENDRASQIRKFAVQLVTRYSQGNSDDAFVSYLAMNYFDRFVSRHALPTDGGNEKETIQRIVVCCITIAAKMRRKGFNVGSFLEDKFLEITFLQILTGELIILNALEWRMRSITPLCYLDHYYPKFAALGGFSRRCINEIIVQSQGERSFTRFRPSDIALSSLMAAASILYPDDAQLVIDSFPAPASLRDVIDLCQRKNIQILPPGRPYAEQSEELEATSTSRKGKAIETEIVPADEAIARKQMNFQILWITDMNEEVIIPPLEGVSQSQGPAATSRVNRDRNTGGFNFCGCQCNCNFLEGLFSCCNIQ